MRGHESESSASMIAWGCRGCGRRPRTAYAGYPHSAWAWTSNAAAVCPDCGRNAAVPPGCDRPERLLGSHHFGVGTTSEAVTHPLSPCVTRRASQSHTPRATPSLIWPYRRVRTWGREPCPYTRQGGAAQHKQMRVVDSFSCLPGRNAHRGLTHTLATLHHA